MQNVNKVLYTQDQSEVFSTVQKAVARNNIGAQEQLTAGSGISISGNEISCTVSPGPTYTAGANVSIDSNNVISATDTTYNVFSTSVDGLVPKANGTGDGAKFLRGDHTWQPPMTGTVGDVNHPNYITVDSGGNLHYLKTKRLVWEFKYTNPTVTLTAQDISRGYAEFPLALTSEGLGIVSNNDMIAIKGYYIETGNILNNKQSSLWLKPHGEPDDYGWLICDGMTTYTETVVGGYAWKAFKGYGLTDANNIAFVDAYLRVPLSGSETAGDTYKINGRISITVFGVAGNDT